MSKFGKSPYFFVRGVQEGLGLVGVGIARVGEAAVGARERSIDARLFPELAQPGLPTLVGC